MRHNRYGVNVSRQTPWVERLMKNVRHRLNLLSMSFAQRQRPPIIIAYPDLPSRRSAPAQNLQGIEMGAHQCTKDQSQTLHSLRRSNRKKHSASPLAHRCAYSSMERQLQGHPKINLGTIARSCLWLWHGCRPYRFYRANGDQKRIQCTPRWKNHQWTDCGFGQTAALRLSA